MSEIRGFRLPPPPSHCDRDRAGSLRRERQPPRQGHRKPRDFGDHGAESAVPNSFLETGEHRLLVAGVDIDNPVRGETDLGERRRKQVLPGDAPKDLAPGPPRDASGEQGGRSTIDRRVATSRHFVQRPERQPATGKAAVDSRDTERKNGPGAQRRALKTLNLLAKPQNGR